MTLAMSTPPAGLLANWYDGTEALHVNCVVLAIGEDEEGTYFVSLKEDGTPAYVRDYLPQFKLHFGE